MSFQGSEKYPVIRKTQGQSFRKMTEQLSLIEGTLPPNFRTDSFFVDNCPKMRSGHISHVASCVHAVMISHKVRGQSEKKIEKETGHLDYLIFVPGGTSLKGIRRDAESPAARIIPLLSIPKILAGWRFATITTFFPTRSSGL